MPRQLISSGSPFEKTMGFSRAVAVGPWCFVSGTVGRDASGAFPDSVEEQARNTLATIGKALAEAGFTFGDVVRAHYYVTEQRNAALITPILGETFGTTRPAATLTVCGLIDPGMKVEIEVTAYRGSD
jgi:enamine deaminase RidA (YjgF/YER057c/UK114 family)